MTAFAESAARTGLGAGLLRSALVAAGLLLPTACTLSDVDLEGRACPCADGYRCDEATNTCVQGDATATASSATGTASTTSSSGTTAASTSSGAGGAGGGTSTSTGEGAASSSSGGGGQGGQGGAGGQGGQGGAGGCVAPLVPADVACGGLTDDFSDLGAFAATWNLTPSAANFVVDGQLTVEMTGSSTTFARSNATFEFDACSLWVRLVTPSPDAGVMARISWGFGAGASEHNLGVQGNILQARLDNAIQSATPYDAATMQYMRMRSSEGVVHFGTSADGVCWDEFHASPLKVAATGANVRIVLNRYSGVSAANEAVFDDFGLVR